MQPNTSRLRQLAEHLLHGKLGHKKFNFSSYNTSKDSCGTAGCAMGECPILWPKHFRFEHYEVMLNGLHSSTQSGMEWFNLTSNQYSHLFIYYSQSPELYGGEGSLGFNATKEQVASNILAFCEIYEPRTDITKELAKLPIEETSDLKHVKELQS